MIDKFKNSSYLCTVKNKFENSDPNFVLEFETIYQNQNSLPSLKSIHIIFPESDQQVVWLDERTNELIYVKSSISTEFLQNKFQKFKKSDFRFKKDLGIEGTRNLFIQDFISFLIEEDRHLKLQNLDI